ncbi:MAG: tetratricopeptide repeat protein [Gemmatimonadales bacterium]
MKTRFVVVGIAAGVAFGGGVALAQAPLPGERPASWLQPQCELNTGHYLVNGAIVYLKGATEEEDSAQAERMLEDGFRNLREALGAGEVENPAVWYFLGRAYELRRDVVGADSAFRKAEEMVPECGDDIDYHRQFMWVPIINGAIDSLQSGALEGGKDLLRAANVIYDKDNVGFYYLGRIFGAEGEIDSALHYYKTVVDIGISDSSRANDYYTTILNIGLLYSMDAEMQDSPELWDSAAAWYQRYREIDPDNSEALLGLADAYIGAGKEDLAMVMYDSVLGRADVMSAEDLFGVGEKLFLSDRFEIAVRAYKAGLGKNPYSRLGLFNLANTYLALADEVGSDQERRAVAEEMARYARRLVEIDPLNSESQRMLAAAYQLQQNSDSTEAVLERVGGMDFELWVDLFDLSPGGSVFQARVVNLRDREVQVPAITCDFLDAKGTVVASGTVDPVTLPVNASNPIGFSPPSEGVVGWRCDVSP